jgi:hypothetical protein
MINSRACDSERQEPGADRSGTIGLLIFKQLVYEASQFARGGGGRLGRSTVGLPVEDAQTSLGTTRRLSGQS